MKALMEQVGSTPRLEHWTAGFPGQGLGTAPLAEPAPGTPGARQEDGCAQAEGDSDHGMGLFHYLPGQMPQLPTHSPEP